MSPLALCGYQWIRMFSILKAYGSKDRRRYSIVLQLKEHLIGWYPSLTKVYDNNCHRHRQKLDFSILQIIIIWEIWSQSRFLYTIEWKCFKCVHCAKMLKCILPNPKSFASLYKFETFSLSRENDKRFQFTLTIYKLRRPFHV